MPEARRLARVTFEEMLELASLGSRVLQIRAVKYAGKFLSKSPLALGLGKLAINRSLDQDMQAGLADAATLQSFLLSSEEYQQAMKAFDENNKK